MGVKASIVSLLFWIISVFIAVSAAKLMRTPTDLKAIAKFRPLVDKILTHDYQRTDSYLIRWLKYKKYDIDEAVEALRVAQDWRKKNKIDAIQNEKFPEFAGFAFNEDSVDNEGRKVFTWSIGKLDFRKIVLSGIETQDRYVRYNWQVLERAASKSAQAVLDSNGTLTDSRLLEITDFQGFNARTHACLSCINLLARILRDFETYYPGITGLAVYINTPRIAHPLVQTILTFLSPETQEAIKVFGTNRTEWMAYLQTVIPPEQLLYQFGGTKKA